MPIWANLLAAAAAAGVAAPGPDARPATATVTDVANSAALCMLAASKKGVDRARFSGNGWTPSPTPDADYGHQSVPVSIEMPQDSDGVARICVVRASLASQDAQAELADRITALLKSQPIEQSNSVIWMVSVKGHRGIQLYTDKTSEQPQVRLIGAEF